MENYHIAIFAILLCIIFISLYLSFKKKKVILPTETTPLLDDVKKTTYAFINFLYLHKRNYPIYQSYIERLHKLTKDTLFSENLLDDVHVSYTINKGDEIVLCLRDKTDDKLMGKNIVMYVVIHELSHIACPELGHTDLFIKIFKFLLKNAVDNKFYTYVNYEKTPISYCSMVINEDILKKY